LNLYYKESASILPGMPQQSHAACWPLLFALCHVSLASRQASREDAHANTMELHTSPSVPASTKGEDPDHLKSLVWHLFDETERRSLPGESVASALDVTVNAEFDPGRSDRGDVTCWGDPSAPITLLTAAIGLQDKYLETLRRNRLAYADQHGVEYCECLLKLDMSREAPWTKIVAIQRLLEDPVDPRHSVMWLDADALVMNGALSINEHVAAQGPYKDAIFSTDLPVNRDMADVMSPLNTGVIYLKNTPWSRSLLKRMYNTRAGKRSTLLALFDSQYQHEQSALMELRAMDPNEFAQHAKVVPWNVMNSIGFRNFCEGDFVVHVVGGGERWLSWLLGVYWPRLGGNDKYAQLELFLAERDRLLPLFGSQVPRCGWFHPPAEGDFHLQELMTLMSQSPHFYIMLCVMASLSFGMCCCFWGREYQRGIK